MDTVKKAPEGKIAEKQNPDNVKVQNANSDTPRVKPTTAKQIKTGPSFIYKRELSLIETPKSTNGKLVSEIIQEYAFKELQAINRSIKNHEQSHNYLIDCKEGDSIQELAFKYAAGLSRIRRENKKLNDFLQRQTYDITVKTNTRIPYADTNAVLCWMSFATLFLTYFESEDDTKVFSEFKFTKNVDDIIVEGVRPVINQAIIDLQKIQDECYFSIFRDFMDPNKNLDEKYSMSFKYSDHEVILTQNHLSRELKNMKTSNVCVHNFILAGIGGIARHSVKIQILINCLNMVKRAPKTLNNLKIVYQVLTKCHKLFAGDSKSFAQHNQNSAVFKDYYKAKSYLANLARNLAPLINDATQKAILLEKTKPISYNNLLTSEIKAVPQDAESKNVSASNEAHAVVDNKSQDTQGIFSAPEKEKLQICENAQSNLPSLLEEDSDEDSLEAIERETNELMEVFRQLCDEDRKEKLKRKELEIKIKPEKLGLSLEPTIIKPAIIILDADEREVLDACLQRNPPHLKISGRAIESLIVKCGGKKPTKNHKGKYPIYWTDPVTKIYATHKSGSYEVTHGGDSPEVLTSEYAGRVGKAFVEGVNRGSIAKETVYPRTHGPSRG